MSASTPAPHIPLPLWTGTAPHVSPVSPAPLLLSTHEMFLEVMTAPQATRPRVRPVSRSRS